VEFEDGLGTVIGQDRRRRHWSYWRQLGRLLSPPNPIAYQKALRHGILATISGRMKTENTWPRRAEWCYQFHGRVWPVPRRGVRATIKKFRKRFMAYSGAEYELLWHVERAADLEPRRFLTTPAPCGTSPISHPAASSILPAPGCPTMISRASARTMALISRMRRRSARRMRLAGSPRPCPTPLRNEDQAPGDRCGNAIDRRRL
jgi:hypothetical protein